MEIHTWEMLLSMYMRVLMSLSYVSVFLSSFKFLRFLYFYYYIHILRLMCTFFLCHSFILIFMTYLDKTLSHVRCPVAF